jgi:succinoglycan biosynthesis protein ExoA
MQAPASELHPRRRERQPEKKMPTSVETLPFVSVLIPMRNEERHIETCLRSLARQDYPRERFEVLVMDGDSSDSSREVVEDLATREGLNLRLIDNPGRTTARGLNLGIAQARGDVIARLDAHATAAPDFLSQSVEALMTTADADGVGGPIESVGQGLMGEAIALAMSSPFGVGNAHFRYSQEAQYTDTVAFPAYRREIFERIGRFAEDVNYGEDDEFHYRLGDAGGKLLLTPNIRSTYHTRSSLSNLFRQYFAYGQAKVEVLRRHPRQARLRQFVPAVFVTGLIGLSVLSLIARPFRRLLVLFAAMYLLASSLASLRIASRQGWRYAPLLPLAFSCLHVAYGLGFLRSLLRLLAGRSGVWIGGSRTAQ